VPADGRPDEALRTDAVTRTATDPVPGSRAPAGSGAPAGPEADALVRRATDLLHARGERMTGARRAVLRALVADGGHCGAEAVVARVAAADPGVHRASVYRALEALSGLGVVQHVHLAHGATSYHVVTEGHAHLHLQCRRCGLVRDVPSDLLDGVAAVLAGAHGFVLDAGHVALSGLCAGCAAAAPDAPPA